MGHQHVRSDGALAPFTGLVPKLGLELLQSLVQLVLGHQVTTVMAQLQRERAGDRSHSGDRTAARAPVASPTTRGDWGKAWDASGDVESRVRPQGVGLTGTGWAGVGCETRQKPEAQQFKVPTQKLGLCEHTD